jgi:hypothetical protein
MAFTNYTELQAEIADWLNRADLTVQIKSFITLAESYLSQHLRCEEQRSILPLAITGEYLPLPSNFRLAENIAMTDSDGLEIEYVTPQRFIQEKARYAPSGKPRFFTFVGRQMRFAPVPDSGTYTAELDHYAAIPPLDDVNTTNWLLDKYPSLYLYGSLWYAHQFVRDPEGIPFAFAALTDAVELVRMETERAKVPTTPKVRFAAIG